MTLENALKILNVVFLAVFGAAGWQLVNEWRKSKEQRHQAELAIRDQKIESANAAAESLKISQKHELEKYEIQIRKLTDDNSRLTEGQDQRTKILEQHIEFLKAQAPAGVSANFDALNKLNEQNLSLLQGELAKCQSALSEAEAEHQLVLHDKDRQLIELQSKPGRSNLSGCSQLSLQNLLAPPTDDQRNSLQRDRNAIAVRTAPDRSGDQSEIIEALGHWNTDVRQTAAKALVSRGKEVVPELVAGLSANSLSGKLVDTVMFWITRFFMGGRMQRYASIIDVLAEIGNPAVPHLEKMLSANHETERMRAILALRSINTSEANQALQRAGVKIEEV